MNKLLVFPTELSLRRFQQQHALEHGWVDASAHTTFARLRHQCRACAPSNQQRLSPTQELLLRRKVVDAARGLLDSRGPLDALSTPVLADVLQQLGSELAALPMQVDRIVDWMLSKPPHHKLYQLGLLFSAWRAHLKKAGFIELLDENRAILQLLEGDRANWPSLLRNAQKIIFRSVRWFTPFEEACVMALVGQKMELRIEAALPPARAEESADRLGQRIRSEIMESPWVGWAEDLSDALAVDNPDLLLFSDLSCIAFSRSAGPYGEIEDLARRIGWHVRHENLALNRIALVVPDVGAVQDIVPHVFGRFQIPFFFRRGRAVLASPCVKAFLAWLAFPLRPERDQLIDLVRNPSIRFEERETVVEQLASLMPRIDLQRVALPVVQLFRDQEYGSGADAARLLKDRMVMPSDDFNAAALETVFSFLQELGDERMPLHDLVDLIEKMLANDTLPPRSRNEQGVWVLNPHDAIGLDFDLVLIAGLNEGAFPGVSQQDALLNDSEREQLRRHLEGQGQNLPSLSLAKASVRAEQESVLFLSAMGMARGQLVLSCQAVDQAGTPQGEGAFFRKLWMLAGWGTPAGALLHPYDQWRVDRLGPSGMFARHWAVQQAADPEARVAMPAESFYPVVPLALCQASDEALQAAVAEPTEVNAAVESLPTAATIDHIAAMLRIEAERDQFLEQPVAGRTPSVSCGSLVALHDRIAAWFAAHPQLSPSALELLAQCRYVFLLERIFGIRDPRWADDTPDPAERGRLIHSILREIYTALADGGLDADVPRYWAVETAQGWMRRTEGGSGAIPLVVLLSERERDYIEFAERVTRQRLDSVVLGHPDVWAAEREKVFEQVINVVYYDVQNCEKEGRYPALFEVKFGGDTALDLGFVKVGGVVDRIDLIFSETGVLDKVRVLDYKGSSQKRRRKEDYVEDVRRSFNCQLPIYALAAQLRFFGCFNTPAANAQTEAGYLFYERRLKDVAAASKPSLIALDEPGLLDDFLATVSENLRRVKAGDCAVDPLIKGYIDYQSVCRTNAVDREDME